MAGTLPASFTRYYDAVQGLVQTLGRSPQGMPAAVLATRGTSSPLGFNVELLPPSPKQLAQRGEAIPEFGALASDVIESKGSSQYEASILLRRSGFYHGILSGESQTELWSRFNEYTKPRTAEIHTLLLLDGCKFPRDHFNCMSHAVVRHSAAEIVELGPPPVIAEAFFPGETLDPDWYSQQWFLRDTETVELKPTFIQIPFLGGDYVLNRYWAPLFALGLYDLPCFAIPIVLESEAKWELLTPRFSLPLLGMSHGENGEPFEVPTDHYKVADREWSQFEAFLDCCDESIGSKGDWARVRIAARRYLRATFLSTPDGHAYEDDDSEDILLQYIYGLESLLLAGDSEAIRDKIATRAALIAGRGDDERKAIAAFVKQAYDARSILAHGGKKTGDIDLRKLRDVFRRVAIVILSIARTVNDQSNLDDLVRTLPISRATQDAVDNDRDEVFALVKATEHLD